MELIKKCKAEIDTYEYKDGFKVEIHNYDKYYDVFLAKGNVRQFIFTSAKEGITTEMLITILENVIPTISLEFPFYEDSEALFSEEMEKIIVVDD